MGTAELTALFSFSVDPLEILLRGSVMYWFLLLLFRYVLRRDVGALGLADVLLLVLIADASQNAMAGDAKTIADGCLLVATIVAWNYGVDWAAFHFTAVSRILQPPRITLVRNGRLVFDNLRRQLMSVDDLRAKLRQHGIEKFEDVKLACMESDGEISAIRTERGGGADAAPAKRPGVR